MDDDDIRRALHAAYTVAGNDPMLTRDLLKQQATKPRHQRMVTSLVAVVATLVVAIPVGVTVLLRGGLNGGSSGSSLVVLDLHMYGADDGWAWSGGDDIMHTTSGVQSWTVVPPPIGTQVIVGVDWAGADSARMLTAPADSYNELEQTYTVTPWITNDAGATWTEGQPFRVLLEAGQTPTNGTVYADLDFVDPMHGWFFDTQLTSFGGPIFIYRTVDGGLHWSLVESTPASGKPSRGSLPVGCSVYGISFVNSSTGWAAGSCGLATLFDVTHDGGATWAPQALDCVNCALYPPQFSSALDGQLFVDSNYGALYVTDDGGLTWSARPAPPGDWPFFVDASHGFAMGITQIGSGPSIVMWTTTDGGKTWEQASGGANGGNGPDQSSQLDFITPRFGWAISVDFRNGGLQVTPPPIVPPQLWQTTDAGSTWTLITPTFTTAK